MYSRKDFITSYKVDKNNKIIWPNFQKLGQILLHAYEVSLFSKIYKNNNTIIIYEQERHIDLIKKVLSSLKLKYITINKNNVSMKNISTSTDEIRKITNNLKNSENDSFQAINFLCKFLNIRSYNMNLKLDLKVKKKIERLLKNDVDQCLGISVKYIAPYLTEESNVNPKTWIEAIKKFYDLNPDIDILLLGHDSCVLNEINGVIDLTNNDFSLYEQLAISQKIGYFLGTASGFCTAVNLSNVPYTIFKSPDHHKESILIELSKNFHLPLGNEKQTFNLNIPTSSDVYNILTKQ